MPKQTNWDDAISEFLLMAQSHYKATYQLELKYKLGMLSTWAQGKKIHLQEFSRRDLDKYLAERRAVVSARSVETDARRAIVFFRYCLEVSLVGKDPLAGYAVSRAATGTPRKPSADELRRLLKAVNDRWDVRTNNNVRDRTARQRRFYRTRDHAFLAGLIETACRVSELCALLLKDYDPKAKQITFRDTKTNDDRTIPISDNWIALVSAWLKIRPANAGCPNLFMTDLFGPLTKNRVLEMMDKYIEFAELEHFTRHSIRHYSITEMAKGNVVSAARLAGQKDLRVTMGYLHRDAEAIRKDHAAADLLGKVSKPEQQETEKKERRRFR